MPTTVTKTIGPGKDYATFSLAEADVVNIATTAFGSSDLVANDGAIVFEADAGFYEEDVTIQSSLTTDATRNVTYKPATGANHDGDVSDGVVITGHGSSQAILVRDKYTVFDGINFTNNVNIREEGCVLKNASVYTPQAFQPLSITGGSSSEDTILIENCWLVGGRRAGFISNGTENLVLRNCTILGTREGVYIGGSTMNIKFYNCFAPTILITDGGSTGTLDGSGNVISQSSFGSMSMPDYTGFFANGNTPWTVTINKDASSTGDTVVFDPYTGKLYDVSGNDAWQVLTNLTDVPTTDIAGDTRAASGFNPGAYEADAAPTATDPPGLAFNPSPLNGGEDISTSTTLSWSEPTGVITSRKIYLGTSRSLSESDLVSTSTSPVTLARALESGTTYFWRVDLTNTVGTTQGITFIFDTSAPVPAFAVAAGGQGSRSRTGATVGFAADASALNTTWTEVDGESRSRRFPTREGDVREKIFKMTQSKSNISFIYRESLRSMIASFNDIGYFNSEDEFTDVRCIHGNAERAIAKLKQENSIILPMISVSQTVSDNDDERRRYESVLVHEKYWDEKKNRAVRVLSLSPRPVNIRYQVNIWCKYMADMDQLLEQVRLKFNPEMNVPTEYSTLAKAYLESEEAVGSMTASDKEDRVIKKTMNIVLRTYIPSPKFLVTSTGEIEEFNIEIT